MHVKKLLEETRRCLEDPRLMAVIKAFLENQDADALNTIRAHPANSQEALEAHEALRAHERLRHSFRAARTEGQEDPF